MKHHFCMDNILYEMTERNYKKLCKLYPMVIGEKVQTDSFYTDDENHEECLDWITNNSKIKFVGVHVLNY